MNSESIFALERPSPKLWTLYLIRAALSLPAIVFTLPYLAFRYHTLRYRFDEEGIHMRVGILFRREVNITYARIQDIHLTAGFIQRWLGLADVQIQTASGSATAELTIEGFDEFAAIRDFLYARMRGVREQHKPAAPAAEAKMIELLHGIRDELRETRTLLAPRRNPPV